MLHHHHEEEEPRVYGVIGEFSDPEEIVVAAHRVREAGYKRLDAYTPFPVHGLVEAIGFKDPRVPWIIFLGGLTGAIVGFGLQAWVSASSYPMNVGGRPNIPWPSFIPVTFECTVLFAAFAAVFGMLGLNGLPKPYHPVFNASRFDLASQNRFFICIEADDPKFDAGETPKFLSSLGATDVELVEK
jgi:hypothetical protein